MGNLLTLPSLKRRLPVSTKWGGGGRYVFNIGGNKYRLVAAIAFQLGLMWVKAVLTHSEYDKGAWK